MLSKKRHLLSCVQLYYSSWEVGEFIIISESEWDLLSLVVDMTTNSAQRLQIFELSQKSF